jgi:hypothetical protein
MAIRDFQTLVGRRVRVDLGADGVYVGELLELANATWRGRVRITGVVSPARHILDGAAARRGHRPDEFVEAAEAHLTETVETGHATYLAALQAEAGRHIGSHSGYQTSQSSWVNEALAGVLRVAYRAEERRLVTGQWRLVPENPVAA